MTDSFFKCPRCSQVGRLYCVGCGHQIREMDRAAATDDQAALEDSKTKEREIATFLSRHRELLREARDRGWLYPCE